MLLDFEKANDRLEPKAVKTIMSQLECNLTDLAQPFKPAQTFMHNHQNGIPLSLVKARRS
jgi:hypothetical protein